MQALARCQLHQNAINRPSLSADRPTALLLPTMQYINGHLTEIQQVCSCFGPCLASQAQPWQLYANGSRWDVALPCGCWWPAGPPCFRRSLWSGHVCMPSSAPARLRGLFPPGQCPIELHLSPAIFRGWDKYLSPLIGTSADRRGVGVGAQGSAWFVTLSSLVAPRYYAVTLRRHRV